MFRKYRLLPMVAGVSLLLLMALPAMAQEGQQRQSQPGATELEISDAELEKAAEAYAEITEISGEFQQSVQQTQDPEERQQLQIAANERMIQAVEDTGLDVETYNRIMQQVRADEELKRKFEEKLQNILS